LHGPARGINGKYGPFETCIDEILEDDCANLACRFRRADDRHASWAQNLLESTHRRILRTMGDGTLTTRSSNVLDGTGVSDLALAAQKPPACQLSPHTCHAVLV
jgi:hypothetical protein